MKSFRHSAPLAWVGDHLPTSGYGRLALALGQITGGGLTAEGTVLRLDGLDFGLMSAQVMVQEAGLGLIVCGVGYDVDENHTYVAMSDGSVWRFLSYLENGMFVTDAQEATQEEVRDCCEQSIEMVEAVKNIVIDALMKSNGVTENDSFSGHVTPNGHAAIMLSAVATGAFVIRDPAGHVKFGMAFTVDSPRGATTEEVSSVLLFRQMSDEEIRAESAEYLKAIGMDGSIFPGKVAKA